MKIKKKFIGIFLLTFVIGSALVLSPKNDSFPNETNIQPTSEIPVQTQTEENKTEIIPYETAKNLAGAEILNDDYWEKEIKYKFELMETGEFHGDEVTAESGEKWVGLFGKNNDFHLASTNINVRLVHDEIVDGNN